MKEIVVVAPFSAMSEATQVVIVENGFTDVDILDADPGNVLERTRSAIANGAKVIISRGGFYELLNAELDIPVVEVKVTTFDLIEAFKAVKQSGESGLIGVIGHRNVIYGAEIIADVMGLGAVCFRTTDPIEISAEMEKQIQRGCPSVCR